MDSVLRQFKALTDDPVMDESCGEMVDILGISRVNGGLRVTVIPHGKNQGVYSTDVSELFV
jgi:hypothetical protein